MDTFIRFMAVIVAIIMLALFPLQYIAQSQDETIEDATNSYVHEFAETARNQGYISLDMYEGLEEKLDYTGELYDLSLTVSHPVTALELSSAQTNGNKAEISTENLVSETNRQPLVLQKNEIQSLAAHVHTDACYEGHRHLPILGNPDVARNTKVFLQVGAGWFGNQYYRYVDLVCDEDNKPIYSIRMPSSFYSAGDVIGCTVLYTYDSNGNPTETRRDFTAKANPQGTGLNVEVYYYFLNILSWVSSNRYYRDGMNETSYTTTFSALPFGGFLPAWDPAGNRYSLPYQGCTYLNGHIDPAGCFPLGNMTQKVNVSMQYSTQPDLQHYYIAITDANAGREILVVSATVYTGGSHGGAGYGNSFNFNYTAFSPTGVLETTRYYAGSQDATMGFSLSPIMQQYFNYFKSLPNITVTTDVSNQYGYTYVANACNVTWALNQLSYIKTAKTPDGFITGRTVWKGSPYQGGFGSTYSCGLSQDDTPDCNRVVTSITPTNPVQTVNKGENIITTATATYLDGHTGTVNCTSNFNTNLVGIQTVTLTYTGLVGNAKTTGTRACTLSVTVKETNIPSYLTVTSSSTTVYNGNKPTFTVAVTYTSGNTKTLAGGSYHESGWSTGPGTKNITFTYTENAVTVSKNITITVLPNLSSITVIPPSQSVKRYFIPSFAVTAYYENGTSKVITSGYTVSGFNNKSLGTQTVQIAYSENNITKYAPATVTFTKLTTTCRVCGASYELDENDTDRGCPVCGSKVVKIVASPYRVTVNRGEALPIIVTATYQNGVTGQITGWTSNYDPNVIGMRQVEIQYMGITCTVTAETLPGKVTCPICGNPYDLNPDGTDPGCPICSKTVTGITIMEDSVTIEKFDILPITVTAKYKDNHTDMIYDWSANFIPDRRGTFEVTVYYKDFTDTVMVKVLDEDEITCPICGTVYNKSENPNGCPVCSVTIVGIEARLRSGGTQVIYKSEIRLEITLKYRDSHQEIVYTGYTITGYNPEALGFQNIVVHYEEFTTALRIEVMKGPARVVCPKGHEYYLNEDGTDPGCPFCEGYDKDGVVTYFEAAYTPEILQVLIDTGEYHLKKGDYLTITIIPRNVSVRARLRRIFFGTNSRIENKKFTYGGEVY